MNLPLVSLNTICDLVNGYAFKSSDYVKKSSTMSCRMSNIRPDGKFNIDYNARFLPDSFSKTYSQFLLEDNDVVIAMTDLADSPKILGVPTVVKTNGKKILLNQRVGKLLIKDDSKVYFPYLQLSLNSPNVRSIYKKFAGGGLQINLGKKDLLSIKIPLPPLAEQKKIAAILDAADSLRQKDQQLIDKYTELSQSLFLDMFGDPVTNKKAWDKVDFSTVGKLDRGKSKHRPRNAPELLGGAYPLIQTGDVANCGGYISKFKATYSELGLKQSRMWKSGTLCITIAANIAKTGILLFDACFPDSVVGFINNEKSNIEYVKFWLSFLQKTLEDSAPMAAQKNINLKILRELKIPLPPIELQNKFAQRIQTIETQKQQAQASLKKSNDLFNSLLQRAFKGELTQ